MGDQSDSGHVKVLSFADLLKGKQQLPTTTVDLSSLPKPTVKDGKPALVIPQELFVQGCEIWRFSLIGRLNFKGLDFNYVKKNLQLQWNLDDEKYSLCQ